jgi:hypothetical protein
MADFVLARCWPAVACAKQAAIKEIIAGGQRGSAPPMPWPPVRRDHRERGPAEHRPDDWARIPDARASESSSQHP